MTQFKMAGTERLSGEAVIEHPIINININGNENNVMVVANNNADVNVQYGNNNSLTQNKKPEHEVKLPVSSEERRVTDRKRGSSSKPVSENPTGIRSVVQKTYLPLREITGALKHDRYKKCVLKLSYLTQRGLWKELHRFCEQLYSNFRTCENTDLEIAVLSFQVIAECLQMKMYNAAEHIALMADLLPRAENREFLRGRLHYVKGYKFRKDSDYVNAAMYFEDALKIFQTFEPCLFHAATLFHLACVKYASLPGTWRGNPLQEITDDIDKASRMFQSSDFQLSFNILQRAIVKQAMVLIDCDSSVGRQRELLGDVDRKVKRARMLLKSLDTYRDPKNPSKYTNCNYLLGHANCHYRLGQHLIKISPDQSSTHFEKAKYFAMDALEVADKHRFNSEIRSINAFLEDIIPKLRYFNEETI